MSKFKFFTVKRNVRWVIHSFKSWWNAVIIWSLLSTFHPTKLPLLKKKNYQNRYCHNRNVMHLTESHDINLLPFSLNSKSITGALCGPLIYINSLLFSFHVCSSPFSHPTQSIFLSGCQAKAVTCESGWLGNVMPDIGSPYITATDNITI